MTATKAIRVDQEVADALRQRREELGKGATLSDAARSLIVRNRVCPECDTRWGHTHDCPRILRGYSR